MQKYPPYFTLSVIISFWPCNMRYGNFIKKININDNICLHVILIQTRKQFPISHKLLRILIYIEREPVHSLVSFLGSWGWSAYAKVWYNPHPPDFPDLWQINDPKTISPVKMFHMGAKHCLPGSSGTIAQEQCSWKNHAYDCMRITWSCISTCTWRSRGGLHHIRLNSYILDVLCNVTPHYWHEMTQFSSRIFRHTQLCIVVIFYEHSMYFCIIRCEVPFTLLFAHLDNMMGTMNKYFSFKIQRTYFTSIFIESMVQHVL